MVDVQRKEIADAMEELAMDDLMDLGRQAFSEGLVDDVVVPMATGLELLEDLFESPREAFLLGTRIGATHGFDAGAPYAFFNGELLYSFTSDEAREWAISVLIPAIVDVVDDADEVADGKPLYTTCPRWVYQVLDDNGVLERAAIL